MDRLWAFYIVYGCTGVIDGLTYEEARDNLNKIHNLRRKQFIIREITEENYQELDHFFDYELINGIYDSM